MDQARQARVLAERRDEAAHPMRGSVPTVIGVEERLRALLRANQLIASDRSLTSVTRRVTQGARHLLNAGYAALGVVGEGGQLAQLVHTAADEAEASRIGAVLESDGLLPVPADELALVRRLRLAVDRTSGGTGEAGAVTRFMALPVVIDGSVYGHLLVADGDAEEFTADDEELAGAFAQSAATAIESARLYDEAARRQQSLEVSAETVFQLLAVDGDSALQVVADRLRVVADADVVVVVVPTDDGSLAVRAASGDGSADLVRRRLSAAGTVAGSAITTGRPASADATDGSDELMAQLVSVAPVGPMLAIPLVGASRRHGALVAGRRVGRARFVQVDLDLDSAMAFAQHVAASLDLAADRAGQQREFLLGERGRLAETLNERIIRRIFAAGLAIQSVAATLGSPELTSRLLAVVDELDETIRQVRSCVFDDDRCPEVDHPSQESARRHT